MFTRKKINLLKQTFYFELLQIEITDLLESKIKTEFQLEIERLGSEPIIIALHTSNKMLA